MHVLAARAKTVSCKTHPDLLSNWCAILGLKLRKLLAPKFRQRSDPAALHAQDKLWCRGTQVFRTPDDPALSKKSPSRAYDDPV